MPFHPDNLPDLIGRVYIVTGATSGIGYHTAARLAQQSAHVYICARTLEKGSLTTSSIKSTYPNAKLSVLVMDHTRLCTIVAAAKHFVSHETSLHGLVNNAGIMCTPFQLTEDGYEEQWQVNYLAHWVLTSHLIPLMLVRSPMNGLHVVRIVNLSSSGHFSAPKHGIVFDNLNLQGETGLTRYGQSKLANILHTKTLHHLYGPNSSLFETGEGEIWTAAVHPGFVKSALGNKAEFPWYFNALVPVMRWSGAELDADRGSWTSVYCVASGEMKRSQCGGYWQRIADPKGWQSSMAEDAALAEELERWTEGEMRRSGWIE